MKNANPQARNSAQLIPFFLFEGTFPSSRNGMKLLQIPLTITYFKGKHRGALAQLFDSGIGVCYSNSVMVAL